MHQNLRDFRALLSNYATAKNFVRFVVLNGALQLCWEVCFYRGLPAAAFLS